MIVVGTQFVEEGHHNTYYKCSDQDVCPHLRAEWVQKPERIDRNLFRFLYLTEEKSYEEFLVLQSCCAVGKTFVIKWTSLFLTFMRKPNPEKR